MKIIKHQGDNSDWASPHQPVVDYFPIGAWHIMTDETSSRSSRYLPSFPNSIHFTWPKVSSYSTQNSRSFPNKYIQKIHSTIPATSSLSSLHKPVSIENILLELQDSSFLSPSIVMFQKFIFKEMLRRNPKSFPWYERNSALRITSWQLNVLCVVTRI